MSLHRMTVRRIQDGIHSRVEPPLDHAWDELTRLRWHAAVVEHDTGVPVSVTDAAYWINDEPVDGLYAVNVGWSSNAPYTADEAWVFLSGVSVGADQARRPTNPTPGDCS